MAFELAEFLLYFSGYIWSTSRACASEPVNGEGDCVAYESFPRMRGCSEYRKAWRIHHALSPGRVLGRCDITSECSWTPSHWGVPYGKAFDQKLACHTAFRGWTDWQIGHRYCRSSSRAGPDNSIGVVSMR